MENTTERKISNIQFKKGCEPKQVGNTPLYLIPNENDEYNKLVVGKYLLTENILDEDKAVTWAKDNILEVLPTLVVVMLETQKEILEIFNE